MTDNANEFARLIKPKEQAASSSQIQSEPQKLQRGSKHIGGYYHPEVSRVLKMIALEEDSTVQDLVGESLLMLFQSRGKTINVD